MNELHEACYKTYKSKGNDVHEQAYKDMRNPHRAIFLSYDNYRWAILCLKEEHIVGIGFDHPNPALEPAFERGLSCYRITLDLKDPGGVLYGLKPERRAYWSEPMDGGPSRQEILIKSFDVITGSVDLSFRHGIDFSFM